MFIIGGYFVLLRPVGENVFLNFLESTPSRAIGQCAGWCRGRKYAASTQELRTPQLSLNNWFASPGAGSNNTAGLLLSGWIQMDSGLYYSLQWQPSLTTRSAFEVPFVAMASRAEDAGLANGRTPSAQTRRLNLAPALVSIAAVMRIACFMVDMSALRRSFNQSRQETSKVLKVTGAHSSIQRDTKREMFSPASLSSFKQLFTLFCGLQSIHCSFAWVKKRTCF